MAEAKALIAADPDGGSMFTEALAKVGGGWGEEIQSLNEGGGSARCSLG